MKKFKIGLIILSLFISTNIVKADTIINIQYGGSNYSEYYYINNITNYTGRYFSLGDNSTTSVSCDSRISCYNGILTAFSSSGKDYYSIYIDIYPNESPARIDMTGIFFDFSSTDTYTQSVYSSTGSSNINRFFIYKNNTPGNSNIAYMLEGFADPNSNNFYMFYDSNFNFLNSGNYVFQGFYDNEDNNYNNMLQVHDGESYPKIKDLIEYSSWSDYENNHLENYTTINLDDYEYVLLSLKNYSQTQAFQTNLQVKGQVGITPIYNYGQTSKDAVTGNKVQDRCNANYDNYTSYPFYILQTDLQNNVIYAVKECSEGSSFKFDNTIFDITYITAENEDDPTVTINGRTYNVIPYEDLPSTATKNEEDNYIPGESENAITGNTVGLNAILKNAQAKMGEMWETLTYFTGFIGQIFSILPSEVHAILISAFAIMIILGVIKIFLGK